MSADRYGPTACATLPTVNVTLRVELSIGLAVSVQLPVRSVTHEAAPE